MGAKSAQEGVEDTRAIPPALIPAVHVGAPVGGA
jgi:hypothetical protein